jgi:hypothetical protein
MEFRPRLLSLDHQNNFHIHSNRTQNGKNQIVQPLLDFTWPRFSRISSLKLAKEGQSPAVNGHACPLAENCISTQDCLPKSKVSSAQLAIERNFLNPNAQLREDKF